MQNPASQGLGARAHDADGSAPYDLGLHNVTVAPEALSAYCAATQALASDAAPVAFPVVWLTADALKQAALALAGVDYLPVHESQSFEYSARLRIGATYQMTATAQLQQRPHRLSIEAVVRSGAGAIVLTMRCVLRLVAIETLTRSTTAP